MDLVRWTILRRMFSKRQVYEIMVDFWSNLLHVPGVRGRLDVPGQLRRDHPQVRAGQVLRPAARGPPMHPAMLVFLNSAGSTKHALNENHGRELLELHTGRGQGRLHRGEVLDSARILTGYHVETWEPAKRTYNPADHWTGPVQVLGWKATNCERRRPARADAPTCATSPRTRRPPSGWPRGSASGSSPTNRRRSIVARGGQGVHQVRHQHQGHPAGPGQAPGLRQERRRQGPDAVPGRDRDLPGAGRQGVQAQRGRRLRLRRELRPGRDGRGPVHVAGAQRLPGAGRRLGVGRADAQLVGHAPHHRRRLVALDAG